jgi:hypothetical protein
LPNSQLLAWWASSSSSEAANRTVSSSAWAGDGEFERLLRLRRKESSKEEECFLLMIPSLRTSYRRLRILGRSIGNFMS